MKRSLLFIFLISFIVSLFGQQTPQWMMPIYFEDGNGDRDTLWIGYDPAATSIELAVADTIFGETWIDIDTNVFNVAFYQYPGMPIDPGFALTNKVLKTIVFGDEFLEKEFMICFHKGVLPLTITWDYHFFYSDLLPFANLYPRPNARIDFQCSSNCWQHPCPASHITILSDTMPNDVCWPYDNTYAHSIYYTNCYYPGESPPINYVFWNIYAKLVPHDYDACYGMDEIEPPINLTESTVPKGNIKIFPNPIFNYVFTIEFESSFTGNITIINTLGGMIKKKSVNYNATSITINLPHLPAGLYYLVTTDFLGNIRGSKIIVK